MQSFLTKPRSFMSPCDTLFSLIVLLAVHCSKLLCCPLALESPCHCGVRNDSTSYIQCSGLGLREIPQFTQSYTYDEIHLADNYINRINADSFTKLRVRQMYLTGNPISHIDAVAFRPLERQLEVLHLDVVTLHDDAIIDSMQIMPTLCLPRLISIRLKGFQLERLPVICPNMTRLSSIALVSCSIHSIENAAETTTNHTPFNLIKHLELSHNPLLSDVPNQFPNLKLLNLSSTSVNGPFSNSTFKKLESLDLSRCGIDKWTVPKLRKLKHLVLDRNRLTSIDNSIPVYPNLKHLSIRSNKLEHLAMSFVLHFVNLEALDLSYNNLASFDCYLWTSKLQSLLLPSNKLNKAPEYMPLTMRDLDLRENEICSFSAPQVRTYLSITNLKIDGNPLFCDCNIRSIKMELERRGKRGVLCSLPQSAKSIDLLDLKNTKCVEDIPKCVKHVHGEYLQTLDRTEFTTSEDHIVLKHRRTNETKKISNIAKIHSLNIKYVSTYDWKSRAQKSILITWKVDNISKEYYGFRVSIVPLIHTSDKAQHYSSQLPITSRHFIVHGIEPKSTYDICITLMSRKIHLSVQNQVCRTWLEHINFSFASSSSHHKNLSTKLSDELLLTKPINTLLFDQKGEPRQADIKFFVAASIVLSTLLLIMSCAILVIAFAPKRLKQRCISSSSSSSSSYKSSFSRSPSICRYFTSPKIRPPHVITSSSLAADHVAMLNYQCLLIPSLTPDKTCCFCYNGHTNDLQHTQTNQNQSIDCSNQMNTTESRFTSSGDSQRHVYHELYPVCKIEHNVVQ